MFEPKKNTRQVEKDALNAAGGQTSKEIKSASTPHKQGRSLRETIAWFFSNLTIYSHCFGGRRHARKNHKNVSHAWQSAAQQSRTAKHKRNSRAIDNPESQCIMGVEEKVSSSISAHPPAHPMEDFTAAAAAAATLTGSASKQALPSEGTSPTSSGDRLTVPFPLGAKYSCVSLMVDATTDEVDSELFGSPTRSWGAGLHCSAETAEPLDCTTTDISPPSSPRFSSTISDLIPSGNEWPFDYPSITSLSTTSLYTPESPAPYASNPSRNLLTPWHHSPECCVDEKFPTLATLVKLPCTVKHTPFPWYSDSLLPAILSSPTKALDCICLLPAPLTHSANPLPHPNMVALLRTALQRCPDLPEDFYPTIQLRYSFTGTATYVSSQTKFKHPSLGRIPKPTTLALAAMLLQAPALQLLRDGERHSLPCLLPRRQQDELACSLAAVAPTAVDTAYYAPEYNPLSFLDADEEESRWEANMLIEKYSSNATAAAHSYFREPDGSDRRDRLTPHALFVPHCQPEAVQEIGQGGNGTVFRVTQKTGLQVAMKRVLLKEVTEVKRFMTEACRMMELSSGADGAKLGLQMHGICFSAGPEKSEVYGEMFMELADMDLHQACTEMFNQECKDQQQWASEGMDRPTFNSKKHGQHLFNGLTRGTYMLNVTEALVPYAIRRIVHGDLKPNNIVLADRHGFLIDLGMSMQVEDGEEDAFCLGGTDGYQPLESMVYSVYGDGYRTCCASDIFALGVTLGEVLLTKDCLPLLAVLCVELPQLLRSMLSVDPADRPVIQEVAVQLRAVVQVLSLAVADPDASVACVQQMKAAKGCDAHQRFTELEDLQRYIEQRMKLVGAVEDASFLEKFVEKLDDYVKVWDAVDCYEELYPYVKSLVWQRVRDKEIATELLCGLDTAFADMEAV